MVGTHVARYRILSRLGAGGMGEVYLAHNPALDRPVALKFLQAASAGDSARRRLVTEAQAAARLDHPFVCKIYEVAEDPPTDASALVNPASSYAGLNQHTGAVEAYEKAFALDPELRTGVFVNHEYGFALVHLGQFDRAAAVSC